MPMPKLPRERVENTSSLRSYAKQPKYAIFARSFIFCYQMTYSSTVYLQIPHLEHFTWIVNICLWPCRTFQKHSEDASGYFLQSVLKCDSSAVPVGARLRLLFVIKFTKHRYSIRSIPRPAASNGPQGGRRHLAIGSVLQNFRACHPCGQPLR